ncbi:hypothetical protein G3I40_44785 [Streptomyces sp. SID14478]|uniref:hypothetical protein n=1 Tax=Streptomyces sp. SID14478 TaxID=2706073 RepID=UPI0013DFAAEE|nr:hypothetical protein [Streptomyces sp. SID14478]NEB82280.1 hypothetical protein [Streptomyces sp. SID14478]
MGVDVVLMQGTSPKKCRLTPVDFVQDGADQFSTLCANSSLPMLNRVDPYRTQILTQADMPPFISELEATCDLVRKQREREPDREIPQKVQDIRDLADRCTQAPVPELHLQGV